MMVFLLSSCIIDIDGDGGLGCVRGSGPTVTEFLNIDEFDAIGLEISADVFIEQGPNFEVRVEGQENIIEELDLDVRNGFWEIEFDRCVRNVDDLRIFITMPDITELRINGSGDIIGDNVFDVGDITLRISGSGNMDLALEADDINSTIVGSGDIRLEGFADDNDLRIDGSGDFYGFNLECFTTNVEILGSGDAEVFVTDDLRVRITGSGDVFYKGNPALDINISGSGRVVDAN